MQAKDVMTAKVVSVSKDTLIHEVVGLLLKYRISAVPVIDGVKSRPTAAPFSRPIAPPHRRWFRLVPVANRRDPRGAE